MAKKALTPKQARFVEEYLLDCNATGAAIRAGFSEKSANTKGPALLKHPGIAAAIKARMAKRSSRVGITADRVLQETETIAFSRPTWFVLSPDGTNLVLAPDAPADAMGAVSEIRRDKDTGRITGIKLWDKPGMLKIAGRHVDVHGFFDRVELTGKNGGPVEQVSEVKLVFVEPEKGEDA